MKKVTKTAKLLGKMGGEVTSASKTEAARANGTKGGRPRKRDKELSESLPSILGPTLEIINHVDKSSGLNQRLNPFLAKCTAPELSNRYETAMAVLEVIRAMRRQLHTEAIAEPERY
jgi:hypothetical protein